MKRVPVLRVSAMVIALVAVAAGGLGEPAAAYTAKGVGVVSALRGQASVTHAPGVATRENRPAQESLNFRDDVFFQDVIDTQRESTAKVLLKGKATLTIRELSRVELREGVVPGEPSRTRSIMGLLAGAFRAVVQRDLRPQDELEIHTPNAVAAVRGTDVVVEVYQDAAPPPLPAAALEPTLQPASYTIAQAPGGTGATTRVFVRDGELVMDGVRAAALQGLEKVGNLPPRLFQFTPDFIGRLVARFAIAAVRAPQGAPQAQVTAALATQAVGQANSHVGARAGGPARAGAAPAHRPPGVAERAVNSVTGLNTGTREFVNTATLTGVLNQPSGGSGVPLFFTLTFSGFASGGGPLGGPITDANLEGFNTYNGFVGALIGVSVTGTGVARTRGFPATGVFTLQINGITVSFSGTYQGRIFVSRTGEVRGSYIGLVNKGGILGVAQGRIR